MFDRDTLVDQAFAKCRKRERHSRSRHPKPKPSVKLLGCILEYSRDVSIKCYICAFIHRGMRPDEEVLTPSGYRPDALVEINGTKVGIEVDGPSHFTNREAKGSTLLKRRQVSTLDGIRIISVPYWEWDELRKGRAKEAGVLFAFQVLFGMNATQINELGR